MKERKTQGTELLNNKAIELIVDEYDVDKETFIECLSHACRCIYGILEIDSFGENEIQAFVLAGGGHLAKKTIKLTKEGMQKIAKKTIQLLDGTKTDSKSRQDSFSYKAVLRLLETDLETISKTSVKMRVLSTRELNDAEKKRHKDVAFFVIVRASRYLNAAERRYFQEKSRTLKKGVVFVLD